MCRFGLSTNKKLQFTVYSSRIVSITLSALCTCRIVSHLSKQLFSNLAKSTGKLSIIICWHSGQPVFVCVCVGAWEIVSRAGCISAQVDLSVFEFKCIFGTSKQINYRLSTIMMPLHVHTHSHISTGRQEQPKFTFTHKMKKKKQCKLYSMDDH